MIRKIKIWAKTADCFNLQGRDHNNKTVIDYDGYPPTGYGFSSDGDSLSITIDNDTGQIIGWKTLTEEDFKKFDA